MGNLPPWITIQNGYYIASIVFHLITIILGIYYFFNSKNRTQKKLDIDKCNHLLDRFVEEYRTVKNNLEKFFHQDFKNNTDFERYKESITEQFAVISTFIESNENIFLFNKNDMAFLLRPSSIIQGNELFFRTPLEKLKDSHSQLSVLKSELSISIVQTYKVCWLKVR